MNTLRGNTFGFGLLALLLGSLVAGSCGGGGNGGDDCGNGTIDTGEDCDGTQLGGETCTSQGFESGDLGCTASCQFDTSGCEGGAGFQVRAADKTLHDTYNATFDWSTDTVAIRYLTGPTHSEADKALFFRNPGLYQDPSGEATITPNPLPDIQGGVATGFDFTLNGGAHVGEQVLDSASIKNAISETPVSSAERANALLWEPAVTIFLVAWDIDKSLDLYYADNAIRAQKWGGANTLPAQTAQHMYLHGGDIWVEITFEDFVELGTGVTDSDQDGYREIYARVNPTLVSTDVYGALDGDYSTLKHSETDFHALIAGGDEEGVLDKLYSSFPMEPFSGLGVAYEITGVGTIEYPFMVIKGMTPKDNYVIILLVEP